jgi:CubicO group peptidase (beta-lactamase class C family)
MEFDMINITKIITLVISATAAITINADTAKNDAKHQATVLAENWLSAQRDYKQFPGMSVAVIKDQEIIFSGAWGHSNAKNSAKATTNTLYSICSNSKLFTSVALMQLRDEGKVTLRDPVKKHLDWFSVIQKDTKSIPVTIEGLLTHSSGLMREATGFYWDGPDFPFPERQQVKENIGKQEMLFAGSRHYQYSNIGLTLAGEIVEAVSGQNYHEYIRENVLSPLDMNDTYSSMPSKKYGKQLAIGYSAMKRDGKRDKVKLFDARAIDPAAGFASSVNDYAKFAKWQFRLLNDGGNEVLDHNTLREMQRPHWVMDNWKSARGLGFGAYRINGDTYVGHGGSCPGYRSSFMLNPKTKTAVIVMINANDVDTGDIAVKLHKIFADISADSDSDSAKNESSRSLPDPKKSPKFISADYSGIYEVLPWGKDSLILNWKGKLGVVDLGDNDPLSNMTMLKHIEGDTFVRIRKDKSEAEKIFFERNKKGNVTKVNWHDFHLFKKG